MWQQVARGNIQHISYIPQAEQHLPFRLMLLLLRNLTIIIVPYMRVQCMLHSPLTTCTCKHTVQELEPTAGTTFPRLIRIS